MTNLLSTARTPLTFSIINLKHPSSLLSLSTRPRKPRRALTVQSRGNNNDLQIDPSDRLISAITYFYPFFDGIQYGKYVINQFTPLQTLIQPLVPSIRAFNSIPFNGFLVFITLYFVVVRNPNFSRCARTEPKFQVFLGCVCAILCYFYIEITLASSIICSFKIDVFVQYCIDICFFW